MGSGRIRRGGAPASGGAAGGGREGGGWRRRLCGDVRDAMTEEAFGEV
jgi:hypothetical protein